MLIKNKIIKGYLKMNIKKIALIVVVSATMLATGLFAQSKSENKMHQSSIHDKTISTEWTNRPYENNEDETRQLCLDGAENIRVIIIGEIEANYDFLSISDNSGNELAKLSGKLNEELTVVGSCISVNFTSNETISKKGFTITVVNNAGVFIPPPLEEEWINRPYENNDDETRHLCVDDGSSIKVTITGEIEASYDFLSISDPSGNELVKVSGVLNEEFSVEGNCITAHFTSDASVTKEGFTITIVDNTSFPDTEWINRPYENNEDETKFLCAYEMVPSSIVVTITGEIEANYDFLSISDTSGNELAKLTGTLNEQIVLEGGCISAHFTSDGSVTKEGFTITVVDNNGSIPPDTEWTNRPYENNEDATKELCVAGADAIVVTITGEIEANYDFLSINDTSGNELAKVSGALNEELDVEGNCISAHFTSDSSVTKEGFWITVVGPAIDHL